MAFDKDYPGRKDWRQPYRGSRGLDRSCRSRGSCAYCANGRRLRHRKAEFEAEEMLREFHDPQTACDTMWDEWIRSEREDHNRWLLELPNRPTPQERQATETTAELFRQLFGQGEA